jgi:UDP-N-acetylmuramoylalanine--D-glutamate ligase
MSPQQKNAKTTVIAGLSQTGFSVALYLLKRGVSVAITDSREAPPALSKLQAMYPEVPVFTGAFEVSLLRDAAELVVSPGIPLTDPFVQQARYMGVPVIGDIELFAREANAPVIAVTGSNGKSTVVSLVTEMAKTAGKRVQLGGNIGVPALDVLQTTAPDLYVLELSSFQLDTTHSLKPAAAVVLNISPDHMDRYPSFEDYSHSKLSIYKNAEVAIVNADDERVLSQVAASNVRRYGLMDPLDNDYHIELYQDESWLAHKGKRLIRCNELRMPGLHNISNALAALALGDAVGIPMLAMLETLRSFGGLPHRTQYVAEAQGRRWYNDSKGTNVGATIAAVEGFSPPLVLIAGGVGKGQDFAPLKDIVAQKCRIVILIGESAKEIEAALDGATQIVHAKSMDNAVALAAENSQPGDTVLLSPACASFDMFKSFEDRGDAFAAAVKQLAD